MLTKQTLFPITCPLAPDGADQHINISLKINSWPIQSRKRIQVTWSVVGMKNKQREREKEKWTKGQGSEGEKVALF